MIKVKLFSILAITFDLKGWDLINLNDNKIQFKIYNIVKNSAIEKTFF